VTGPASEGGTGVVIEISPLPHFTLRDLGMRLLSPACDEIGALFNRKHRNFFHDCDWHQGRGGEICTQRLILCK
jgi:hypothetical protein